METLKKTIAAMAICLAALSASAAVLTQEGFETSRASLVADDSEADYSVVQRGGTERFRVLFLGR